MINLTLVIHDTTYGYSWVLEGLPKWNGFISGWMSWFAYAVAHSLYAIRFEAYCDQFPNEFNMVIPLWEFNHVKYLLR